jgi:excisionase family DNA binding protein
MTASAERRYRVAELADLWDVDPSTVYRMIYAGRLRAERHGPRRGAIRVTADAVADYLDSAAGAVA